MREIKFRVWYNNNMNYTPLCSMGIFHFVNRYNLEAEKKGFIMQLTGLKDKNGKDIYEGDIVKYESKYRNFIDVIIYNEGFACFTIENEIIDWMLPDCNYEIIGNIHENPELLKH